MALKKGGSIQLVDDVLITSVNLATEITGTLPVGNGGTGQTTYTNGQLLIGNTTGNTLTKATLTAGAGVTINNGTGSIEIVVTGYSNLVSNAGASTDNAIARFDGATGKIIQNSGVTISDTNVLAATSLQFASVGQLGAGGAGLADLQILVSAGSFRVINSAYSTTLFSVAEATGNTLVQGNLTVNGAVADIANGVGAADALLQIASGRTTSGYAFIDLIGDTTYTDYGLRLIRGNTGANATSYLSHRGTGELGLFTQEAAPISLYTTGVQRVVLAADGSSLTATKNGAAQIISSASDTQGVFRLAVGTITADWTADTSIAMLRTLSNHPIVFITNSVDRGRFLSTGELVLTHLAGVGDRVVGVDSTGQLKIVTVSGTGDVVGPASATDNAITRYDGTTGKLIQNSSATLLDDGTLLAGAAIGATALAGGSRRVTYTDPTFGYILPSTIDIDANNKLVLPAGSTTTAQLRLTSTASFDTTPDDGDVIYSTPNLWQYVSAWTRWRNIGRSFSLPASTLVFSPADTTNLFFGNKGLAPSTTAAQNRIYVPFNCRLTHAELAWNATGVAGSTENISIYVRVNNTTDNLIQTIGNTAAFKRFTNTGLGIQLLAGDYIEFKIIPPVWATNPTNVSIGGYVLLVETS